MTNKVTIPRERRQYLVDFFQKLDRIMTGLPLKVIVKDLPQSDGAKPTALTDGKRVWLNWDLLTKPLTTSSRLGINYQQVAHCYYGDPRYYRELDTPELKHAAGILLAARDETLFAMMYPSVVPYLISMVQEIDICDRNLSACQDIWPLLYGRKYLPQPARFVCLPQDEDPHVISDMIRIIDEFVGLAPERTNVTKMVELTEAFAELIPKGATKVDLKRNGIGKLLRGSKHIDNAIHPTVVQNIKVTLDKDRTYLKKRIVVTNKGRISRSSGGPGGGGSSRLIDTDTIIKVTRVELDRDPQKVIERRTTAGTDSAPEEIVVTDANVPARSDNNLSTDYSENSGSGGGGNSSAGSGGKPLAAVELIEEGKAKYTKLVWKDTVLEQSWKTGDSRLDAYKTALTTSDVRDLIMALEAEVLFDTDQLKKAGWEGCAPVTAELRTIRNGFEKELQLASRTLKNRFAAGRRGNVSMKLAMRAERLPNVNIFETSTTYLDQNDLDVELVMLCDASGSMSAHISQAMKAQWLIGSAYEKRGAKVTIIPFNNVARDPLKGRDDTFSDRIYPYCEANGGTQPHGALTAAKEIFDKAGSRFKVLFILTDGAWNSSDISHKIIDNLNYHGVLTTLVFMGGDGRDYTNVMETKFHHCTEGFRINSIDELLPEMRNTFFKTFNKAIIRTLRRYY